jgi:hypothetical protein
MMELSASAARSTRLFALLGAVALGAGLPCLFRPGDARAQSAPASVIVPHDGLMFRTPEGRILARLSSGPPGGMLELYDAEQHPSLTVRAGSPAPDRGIGGWSPGEPEEDLVDSWTSISPRIVRRPASGL